MANAAKKGIGFYFDAIGIILAIVGLVITVVSSTMSSDYALGSLPMYIIGIVAGVVLAGAAAVIGSKDSDTGVVSMIATAVAVFLLAYVAISVIGSRILLASGLLSWNAANEVGWSVFYVSIAATACLLISALVLVIGAFMPTAKKA